MVEVVGDPVWPSELIIPSNISGANNQLQPTISGAIMLSGAKLVFYTGSAFEEITSS